MLTALGCFGRIKAEAAVRPYSSCTDGANHIPLGFILRPVTAAPSSFFPLVPRGPDLFVGTIPWSRLYPTWLDQDLYLQNAASPPPPL